ARKISQRLDVPTIGIGASPACDGQILVTEDMTGLFSDFTPRFVKRYGNLGGEIAAIAASYGDDVRAGRFPTEAHCFGTLEAEIDQAVNKQVSDKLPKDDREVG
ncbi:MAG: hypothetical protein HOI33_08560, partial [Rhodospirillaceae bacterium]|nr:hypothetical protein [Rhodospirillaceae bacterium]